MPPKKQPTMQEKKDISQSIIKLLEFFADLSPYPGHPATTVLEKFKSKNFGLLPYEEKYLNVIKEYVDKVAPAVMLNAPDWQYLDADIAYKEQPISKP